MGREAGRGSPARDRDRRRFERRVDREVGFFFARRFLRGAASAAFALPLPERGLAVVTPDGVPGHSGESLVGDAGDAR